MTFQEMANCQAVILSVEDEAGQRIIIEDLLEATRSPEVGLRQAAAVILNIYCSKTKADYTAHLRNLVSGLIQLFNDTNSMVLNESWDALNAITKVGPGRGRGGCFWEGVTERSVWVNCCVWDGI